MAAVASPSHSEPKHHDDEQPLQNQDPNSTQLHPETLDLPNSPQSPGVQHEDTLLILDDDGHQSGTTLPQSILLTDNTEHPPVMSPTNIQRRITKRKNAGTRKTYKRKKPTKKIQNLTDSLNPVPFVPRKTLDLVKHEEVLKRLGLYEFSKIEFDRNARTDLIVQLIVNYDSKKRCSYVNDSRVNVNRPDLARALKLPTAKQDKGSSGVEEVDLDSEVFSDEAIGFIEDFVFNWMILHDESWVMPTEIANWTRCIKDGHPEKLDFASLIWYNVEKELSQGDKLVDCHYAPHLQYLIKSQKDLLFKEGDDDNYDGVAVADDVDEEIVKADEEKGEKEKEETEEIEERDEKCEKEEVSVIVEEQKIELTLGTDVDEIAHEEVKEDDDTMADADEECTEEMEEQGNFKNILDDQLLHGCQSSHLNNFEDIKVEEVDDEQIEQVADAEEECMEEMEEQGNFKNILGDQFLQRCQSSHLNNFEDIKVEEVDDEQIEQVEDEDEGGERMDEGFDMEANDDSFDRDGLTDNFLQGVETSHNPYNNSHGMDLFGSRDGSYGGPSFFNNGGKRVMDPEEDIQNSKRLKPNEIWDKKQSDISFCFDQMQQFMQKAKMIHESKERSYEELQYSQQMAMGQLQERQQIMEMIIKSKDEELEKKHGEVFRLERELYLMGDLLEGYRKALNDTRLKFSDYRKRFALQEEPLYKDAGPGGLVLSTREIEKQRLKQEEEDMMKFQMLANNFEQDCTYQLELQNDRLLPLVDKLASLENEVQKLKQIAIQPKEPSAEPDEPSAEPDEPSAVLVEPSAEQDEPTAELDVSVENHKLLDDELSAEPEKSLDGNDKIQKLLNENESSVDPENNQKSPDEIPENDAIMESVPPDADESEEKGGGEEH